MPEYRYDVSKTATTFVGEQFWRRKSLASCSLTNRFIDQRLPVLLFCQRNDAIEYRWRPSDLSAFEICYCAVSK
jgi:hypothetical protein